MPYKDKNRCRERGRERYKEKRENNTFDAIKQKFYSMHTRAKERDISVDSEWSKYENFENWMILELATMGIDKTDAATISKYNLDKDAAGYQTYSPDACILIPHSLNVTMNSKRDSGITKRLSGNYSVRCYDGHNSRVNIGTYPNYEEACKASNEFSYKTFVDQVNESYEHGEINDVARDTLLKHAETKFK